jgi:hypothetical protein
MPRRPQLLLPLILAAVLALTGILLVGGCGGGGESDKTKRAGEQQGDAGGEEAEREDALKQIRREDSVAFYQLSTTTGLLNTRAAALAHGERPPRESDLADARVRVRALTPRDVQLQRLRIELLRLLGRPPPAGDRRAARATLADTSRLVVDLARYTHAHQGYAALAPD